MTTVRSGIPTIRRPLSVEQRIARAVRKSEEAALVAVAVDGRVDDVLSGDETFTAVNVAGTDVAPFLSKTDGEKLTDALGLAEGLVDSERLSTTAIRPGAPATNPTAVTILGLSAVGGNVNAPGAALLCTTTFDVPADGDITLVFSTAIDVVNNTTFELALLVDYFSNHSMQAIRDVATADIARYREIRVPDGAGGIAPVSIVSTVFMTAGSHTLKVLAMDQGGSTNGSVPAGAAVIEVYLR